MGCIAPPTNDLLYAELGLDTAILLKQEKLALFLDIDNTLVHAIITYDIPYSLWSNSSTNDMFTFQMATVPPISTAPIQTPHVQDKGSLVDDSQLDITSKEPDTASSLSIVNVAPQKSSLIALDITSSKVENRESNVGFITPSTKTSSRGLNISKTNILLNGFKDKFRDGKRTSSDADDQIGLIVDSTPFTPPPLHPNNSSLNLTEDLHMIYDKQITNQEVTSISSNNDSNSDKISHQNEQSPASLPRSTTPALSTIVPGRESSPRSPKPLYCLVKPRPGVIPFLRNARKFFKIYICTFGSHEYASEIRNRLNALVAKGDQNLKLPPAIEPEIASREVHRLSASNPLALRKNLRTILNSLSVDIDERMCICVDDRIDVWEPSNVATTLLKIHPFSFFFSHPIYELQAAEHGLHSTKYPAPTLNLDLNSIGDLCLKDTWMILSQIHRLYFKQLAGLRKNYETIPNCELPSVRPFLTQSRISVLEGVVLAPQGKVISGIQALATYYGATITDNPNSKSVTHILVSSTDPDTCKKIRAQQKEGMYPGVFVVTSSWITDCARHLKRVSEDLYLLEKRF